MPDGPGPTPPQTAGPFVQLLLLGSSPNVIAPEDTAGARIRIEGAVCDGRGEPVGDAMIELWQASADGRPRGFRGFGRSETDGAGRYWFETIRPGPLAGPGGRLQAPHVTIQVFARGLMDRLSTRAYFEHEGANAADPVLESVPDDRRSTLLARSESRDDIATYRFDIVLQGDRETVFFDV
jgi:protocatechuate 3,4-dioxygenase alpha subunit